MLYDKILGGLLGAASGDAMGAATEARSEGQIIQHFGGRVTTFQAPPADTFGAGSNAGQYTDDFSSAWFIARYLVDDTDGDIESAVKKALIDWSEHPVFFDRFAGPTTRKAIAGWKAQMSAAESAAGEVGAGRESRVDAADGAGGAGSAVQAAQAASAAAQTFAAEAANPAPQMHKATNGAAMHISPVGLLYAGQVNEAIQVAARVSMVTHRTYLAVSGACAVAAAVAEACRADADLYSVLAAGLYGAAEGERIGREQGDDTAGPSVYERTKLAIELGLDAETPVDGVRAVCDAVGNGLHISEAVPCAFGIVAATHGDACESVYGGVNVGYDTDTIATMAGAIAGALQGAGAFPASYLPLLEQANGLDITTLARDICVVASQRAEGAGLRTLEPAPEPDAEDRIAGALAGGAVGDAMAAATDGLSADQIAAYYGGPVCGLVQPGTWVQASGNPAGRVTDAFSLAWQLADELVRDGGRATTDTATRAIRAWGAGPYARFAGLTDNNVLHRLNNEGLDAESFLGHLGNHLFKGHYYALSSNEIAGEVLPAGLVSSSEDEALRAAIDLALATHDDVFSISGACAAAFAAHEAMRDGATPGSVFDAALRGSAAGETAARGRADVLDYPGSSVTARLQLARDTALAPRASAREFLRALEAVVGSGPAIAETLPCALAIVLYERADVMACICDGVNLGDETCAVAMIAGTLAGALRGSAGVDAQMARVVFQANNMDAAEMCGQLSALVAAR